MTKVTDKEVYWGVCKTCKGTGKKRKSLPKKTRIHYKKTLEQFEKSNGEITAPVLPKGQLDTCVKCKGTGLIESNTLPTVDKENYPHIAIIGGGIGGVALAIACLHRGIPFTLYERDVSFNTRSQGYGLTLQQASKAMAGLGIVNLKDGITSTRHVVHTTEGEIIGEWGVRKWGRSETKTSPKRTNIHIARQSLRLALLEQLGNTDSIKWGHQLLNYKESEDESIDLSFKVNHKVRTEKADLIVGADGIRSTVRKQLIGNHVSPLRYLNCIVILGICPLKNLEGIVSPLLDSATVFQTANGNERIYMMPFDSDTIMWQLSFPLSEKKAKELNSKGAKYLKEEACKRTQWHSPIPQIVTATNEAQISGYPVYDRELLKPELLEKGSKVTLIGDAAHPMSPFKGQGANQALLDALSLARSITKNCKQLSKWREIGLRKSVLTKFEAEMIARSASKVKDSEEAAKLLHSEIVLYKGDGPRGKHRKKKG
ncbi:NAD(P)/FAD-dependent oxidoreductase [Polaribacter undariae]|uniref:NAD(P)/FAD-dependent oxidoreductase n=1 Tax=Polaribacter sejongensis TaxID=985043 RepID=A0AAJ1QWR6_9FLAO|nr:NAD(P)/FAD-dependent oxidoreductase [Polaribacter undariae]MDN3619718.1 NAD(P)/FAD-dependent oxidoreductase [Polaribacter undariae]UWD33857.1 FAD-dependent monooxygenase [Polaribacter undariae]